MHESKTGCRGFTLIELLVVLAIISILIGLLFPAVQYVRAAAARTKCSNNLRQFGTAMQSYVASHGRFPPGYKGLFQRPGWSWGTLILPYLEETNRYEQIDINHEVFGNGANPALPDEQSQQVVHIFRCPANGAPELNPLKLDHALSNYRAVTGPKSFRFYAVDMDMGGIMFQNSRIRPKDIMDGMSNTLLIGECVYQELPPTYVGQKRDKKAALWIGMSGLRDRFLHISDVMWWVDHESAVINGPATQAFSSDHPGGALFAFADGSIRFFTEGGDIENLRWLAGREDQQIVHNEF